MTATSTAVSRYSGGSDVLLQTIWEESIAALYPAYSLPVAKFAELLAYPTAVTFVARDVAGEIVGFALTYTIMSGASFNPTAQHLKGTLSALCVRPSARGQGAGSALHETALTFLTAAVRDSFPLSTPPATESSIQLGSVFPRIFPGLPAIDAFKPSRAWLEKRGWKFGEELSIDLYGAVPTGVDQDQFQVKPRSHGITFRPATKEDEAGIMAIQADFQTFTGWPDMFPKFFKAGKWGDIHIAVNKDGEVIGATLAALAPSPMHNAMAWPSVLGKNCGTIGCVGVSSKTRGEGAGVGMIASAFQELERRGADGCFIDWVVMKDFYERFGVSRWEAPYVCSFRKVTATSLE